MGRLRTTLLVAVAGLIACGDDGASADTDSDAGTSSSNGTTSAGPSTGSTTLTSTTTGPESTTDGTGSTSDASTSESSGTAESSSTGEVPELPVGASGSYLFPSDLSFTVFDVEAHPDGGVVLVGNVQRDGVREAAIVHIADDGEILWARRTNLPTNEQFFGVLVEGSAVYGVGLTRRDTGGGNSNEVLVAEFALDGTHVRSVLAGNPGTDEHAWDMIATSGGGFVLTGYTDQTDFGDRDGLLIGFDADLQLQWNIGVGGDGFDQLYGAREDDDGGFLGVGVRGRGPEASDSLLIKVDAAGGLVYSASFGNGGADVLRGVAPLASGGYLLVGETSSWGAGSEDGYFGVFNPDGDPAISLSTLGGPGYDVLRSLVPAGGDRFIVGGQAGSAATSEDTWLARIDASGELALDWQFVYDAPRDQRMPTGATAQRADGGIALAVSDFDNPGEFDPAVLYTDSLGGIDGDCPAVIDDPFAPAAVEEVVIDSTLSQGVSSFTRTALAPGDEPFVALDLGAAAGLCR